MRDKDITVNAKLADMRAIRAASAPLRRGDLVLVVPSKGVHLKGLLVETVEHELYGTLYDVLVGGSVHRFEAERVSKWKAT